MKRESLTLASSAIVVGVFCAACYLAPVHAAESPGIAPTLLPTINPLLRRTKKVTTNGSPPIRDPFFLARNEIASTSDPLPANTPPAPPEPAMLALSVIGKHQDEQGWVAYIAAPDGVGGKGQVWVVRQGELFDKRFRVSKLHPPVLIISSLHGRQTRTFDIGSDEE